MQRLAPALAEIGASLVAVGFSPAEPLAVLADHLDWQHRFLSDPELTLYHRLGFGRAPRRKVYTRATLRIYRDARARGETIRLPVEDPLQLGGDVVVGAGRALRVFRPASPDDRPEAAELLAAVAAVAGSPP